MLKTIVAVCSNVPRASSGSAARRHTSGATLWGRDVFHASGANGKTACGKLSGDWLTIGTKPVSEAVADTNFCQRCAAIVQRPAPETESA